MLFGAFHSGVNVGGWLSQYDCLPEPPQTEEALQTHFRTYITREDLLRIASWGFDHIRLPVSGFLLYDPREDSLNPQILDYIDQCVFWCREAGLNMILDLHSAEGNVPGAMDVPMPLLVEDSLQQHFYSIWEKLAAPFQNEHSICLMFDLLNEVSDASGYLWNRLYKETVHRIRAIDPFRWILVGSNHMNSVAALRELDLLDDPLTFYNFHYYDPQVFTHQNAHFSDEMKEFGQTVTYPGNIAAFGEYLERHPEYQQKHALTMHEKRNDLALMERLLKDAESFVTYSGRGLYCGEFGVIDTAPPEEAVKWIRDLVHILDRNRIGHALWNYKAMDFGLLDAQGNPGSDLIIQEMQRLHAESDPA